MKKILLVLLLLVTCLVSASYAVDSEIIEAGLSNQAVTFDRLVSQKDIYIAMTKACTALDTIATNTTALSYANAGQLEFPCMLRVVNLGTASLTYTIYSVDSNGVKVPTGGRLTDKQGNPVVSGRVWEQIFYRMPNLSFGSTANATYTFEIWSVKGNR